MKGFDPSAIDLKALAREIVDLRNELDRELGEDDLAHLRMLERRGRVCFLLGYGTAWIAPNPLSVLLIHCGLATRVMMGHHILHGAYDRIPDVPKRYTSRVFAQGRRRFFDWADWIDTDAWHHEHNRLHHCFLGETRDPDIVDDNVAAFLRTKPPRWKIHLLIAMYMSTWKWARLGSRVTDHWQRFRARREGKPEPAPASMLDPRTSRGREYWRICLLPHAFYRFALLPGLFMPLGPIAMFNVFTNTLFAEVLDNLVLYMILGPSHVGDDLYRCDGKLSGKGEFYLRAIVGTANYTSRGEFHDWLMTYVNYHVEHHIWPDLTLLQYRKAAPKLKALCARLGLPYTEESLWARNRKLLRVIYGHAQTRRVLNLTDRFEPVEPVSAAS